MSFFGIVKWPFLAVRPAVVFGLFARSAPARAFRMKDRGVIRVGMRDDLLLVEGDPSLDILNARRIVNAGSVVCSWIVNRDHISMHPRLIAERLSRDGGDR